MMAISPTPDIYASDIFGRTQRPASLAFGFEGSASFQPVGSDWVFSAAVRYGRAHADRHAHQQGPTAQGLLFGRFLVPRYAAPFADSEASSSSSHAILDFSAGKDVGLGKLGSNGTSLISLGVRFAQFSTRASVHALGRPSVQIIQNFYDAPIITFYNYEQDGRIARSFRGMGPTLSWSASANLAGDKANGEVTLDWGVNGSLLFGRQRSTTSHTTKGYHLPYVAYVNSIGYFYDTLYEHAHHSTRSRKVAIPNLGGFAGISVRYPNAKFSVGYRTDFFFGAVDAGIDQRHTKDLGFHGPFATISIGLGG
jgi:hypothetical protein